MSRWKRWKDSSNSMSLEKDLTDYYSERASVYDLIFDLNEAAESVLAIDNNRSLLDQAQIRCSKQPNVRFQVAYALKLEGVPEGFNAAFGHCVVFPFTKWVPISQKRTSQRFWLPCIVN